MNDANPSRNGDAVSASHSRKKTVGTDHPQIFMFAMAGGFGVLLIGFILAWVLNIDLKSALALRFWEIGVGVLATIPLAGSLFWFMRTNVPVLARFRESQLEFISSLGFHLTTPRIIAMSAIAGLSEEVVFRGVLQTFASNHVPMVLAIILTNILFGALHARTLIYAVIAGILGLYLGLVYWATGGLWAVIIAHALYDIAAFDVARRQIRSRKGATGAQKF